ncbi:MAG: hypothetical protein AB4062_02835, partial [Crocosphaera sp.]
VMIFIFGEFLTFMKSKIQWLLDCKKWRKWVKKNKDPNTIEIQELLIHITCYNTKTFRNKLITISYERELIVANKNTEKILNELAMAIEKSFFLEKKEENRIKKIDKIIDRKRNRILKNSFKNPTNLIKLLVSTFKSSKRSKHTLIERMLETYSGSEFLTDWLKQYTRKDKDRLVDLGSDFLDELYMLIEQIQARQKIPEKSNN